MATPESEDGGANWEVVKSKAKSKSPIRRKEMGKDK